MAGYSEPYLVVEDYYGRAFFKALIDRLVSEGHLPRGLSVPRRNIRRLPGECNVKLKRILASAADEYHPIVLVLDAEGRPVDEVRRRIEQHVPPSCREDIKIVVLDYCAEEWICIGLGIEFSDDPVRALKNWLRKRKEAGAGYHKYMLAKFVPELDLERLIDRSRSFKAFLEALRGTRPR